MRPAWLCVPTPAVPLRWTGGGVSDSVSEIECVSATLARPPPAPNLHAGGAAPSAFQVEAFVHTLRAFLHASAVYDEATRAAAYHELLLQLDEIVPLAEGGEGGDGEDTTTTRAR